MDKTTRHEALKEILKDGIVYSFKAKPNDNREDSYDVLVDYLESREAFALYTHIVEPPDIQELNKKINHYQRLLSEIMIYIEGQIKESRILIDYSGCSEEGEIFERTLLIAQGEAKQKVCLSILNFVADRLSQQIVD